MSVHVAVMSERASLVLALTMLVPDWDVDIPAEGESVSDFDAVVIESTTTEEGLAAWAALVAPPFTVVAGDVESAAPSDDVVVLTRPFTVADLRDLIQDRVAPEAVVDPPAPAPRRGFGRRKHRAGVQSDPTLPPSPEQRPEDNGHAEPPASGAEPEPRANGGQDSHDPPDLDPIALVETSPATAHELSSELDLDVVATPPDDQATTVGEGLDDAGGELPPSVEWVEAPVGLADDEHDLELQDELAVWTAVERTEVDDGPRDRVDPTPSPPSDESHVAEADEVVTAGEPVLPPPPAPASVPLPSVIVDLSALERRPADPPEIHSEAEPEEDSVIEVLGGYEYREPQPTRDVGTTDAVETSLADHEVELDIGERENAAGLVVEVFNSEQFEPVGETTDVADVRDAARPLADVEAIDPVLETTTAPSMAEPTNVPEPVSGSTHDISEAGRGWAARSADGHRGRGDEVQQADGEGRPGPLLFLRDAALDRIDAWRDRRATAAAEPEPQQAEPLPSAARWAGDVDAVALLAETLNAFEPVTSAVWTPDADGAWRPEVHFGLRPAESRRMVSSAQPLFRALAENRHGVLLSPADYARGYLAGIPGTWADDVLAAAVPGPRGACLAIVVVGGSGYTPRMARRLVTLAEDAGGTAKRDALASAHR